MGETLGLKNVNMLTKEQYGGIAEPAADELYAISGSGFGFPSSRYVDLTLGATGSTYTAPANGWVILSQQASSSNTAVSLVNLTTGELQSTSKSTSGTNDVYIPVKAADTFKAYYIGSTSKFRFIYAEGEE